MNKDKGLPAPNINKVGGMNTTNRKQILELTKWRNEASIVDQSVKKACGFSYLHVETANIPMNAKTANPTLSAIQARNFVNPFQM